MANHDADVELRVTLNTDDVTQQANALQSQIEQIFDGTKNKRASSSFVRLKQNLRDLYAESNKLNAQMEQMRQKPVQIVRTEELQKAEREVIKLSRKLIELKQQLPTIGNIYGTSSKEYTAMTNKITNTVYKLAQQKIAVQSLLKSGAKTTIPTEESAAYRTLLARQAEVNDRIQVGIMRMNELDKSAQKVGTTVRKIGAALGGVALRAFSKLNTALKGVGAKISGISTGVDNTKANIRTLLKFGMKYILGLRTLFILYKRVRNAGIEAYKGLASQFPELKAEIDQLTISFFQLKNSIATMAQPILSALVPALKTVMGWLVSVMNALANFFAILTGSKYIYKAAKTNNALAKSIKGTGKAAKEANEDIAEYDNLILIQQDKDNGGSGGAGDFDQYAGAWEKVEAESDFAQKLKDAINRGDWEGVGQLFADKLNTITKKANDWINNKLRPEGKKWATRIGKILGGLTDGWDSELTGKTIVDGLMSVMDIVATFYETYPWKTLGTKVSGLINSAFTSWEPETVARFLSGKFNKVIQFFSGLLDEQSGVNWKLIGTKIGESLKKTIEKINWKELGADLSKLASGILTTLASFLESSDVGKTVGEAINRFLNGIDFAKLTTDLVTLAVNIIDSIADAIGTVDWYAVGKAIGDILANIDWGKFLQSLTTLALNLLKGIASAIAGLFSNPAAIASLAEGLIVIFAGKQLWSKVFGATAVTGAAGSALSTIFAGTTFTIPELLLIFESIKFLNDPMQYMENIREWLKHPFDKPEYVDKSDNLVNPFKSSKTSSPFGASNTTNDTSLNIYHQQIDEINADIATTKNNMEEAISSSLHYAETAMHNAGVVIGETAQQTFDGVGASGSNTLHKLSTDAVDASGTIATQMETAKNKSIASFDGMETEFGNMSDGIKDSVATVPDSFEDTFTDAYTRVTNSFDQTKQFFGDVAEGVKSPFSTMADFFESTFSNSWNGVVDVFSTNTPEFKTIQDNISGSFKTVINGMITSVNNSITSPFQTLSNLISQMKNLDVGGTKIFSNLRNFVVPSIPKLAQGAVLPPNQPFLAMVGDQKRGTNVEAPLETIMEALRQVMQETNTSNNQPIVLQLNGNQIAQAVWSEEDKRYKQTGTRYR